MPTTVKGFTQHPAIGAEMEELGIIEDGAAAIANGKVVAVSKSEEILNNFDGSEEIDATGKTAVAISNGKIVAASKSSDILGNYDAPGEDRRRR